VLTKVPPGRSPDVTAYLQKLLDERAKDESEYLTANEKHEVRRKLKKQRARKVNTA
jgi:hypothetical protein